MTGIVVKAKVKEQLKGLNLSADFMPTINKKVNQIVLDAIERAKANQRKTVMARDL